MDLNMTDLWFHGKEHIASSPFPQAVTPVNFACLGSSETVGASKKLFQQSNQSLSVPDDGCRLVLGLGPTQNLHCADNSSSGGSRAKESSNLFSQHFAIADHGLKLGISRGSTRNFHATTVIEKYSHQNKHVIVFPLIDERSTSAKRKPGGCMLPLLFAPRSDDTCPPVTDIQHVDTVDDDEDDHTTSLNQQKVQTSPEPSATTDCSFAATSDMIVASTSTEQRSHQRHPKKCRFNGCSKGARGASGLCISHGGGQRCQKPGCNKGAESRTAYCKSHGGGKRCQQLGCTKSAEGKTEFCIAHGGGRRCGTPGCTKAARGRSGFCIKHGGGKRCRVEGCSRSAEGQFGLCISHGGGRRCQYPNCGKGAQGSTMFCKSHGGGKRCIFEGCTKGAEGNTLLCKGHGGGKRCLFEACPKSVHGGTSFCVAHGGGKRCSVPGCTKSARGRTDCCVRHGGGKRCKVDGCDKSAQGSTDFCKAHGGGKRCAWSTGCERFARGRSGLCAAHVTLMASKQGPESGQGRGMIRNGLFSRIDSTSFTTPGSSMDHAISSSRLGASSDCGESLEDMRNGKLLIPHQVLVPGAMKPSSSHGNGQEDGGSQKQQCFGFVVPEGRVHGGGLMSMLGAGGNLDDPKA